MTLVERNLAEITEHLLTDFQGRFSLQTVVAELRACAGEDPSATPERLEQATRASLIARSQRESAPPV